MELPKITFAKFLKDNSVRHSGQREKILDVFLNTGKHLTVAEIYQLVRKKYPEIGYATVYRAMKVVEDSGLAETLDFGDGVTRYEHKYGRQHHDHLICCQCGKSIEVVKLEIEKLQEKMAKEHGFTPIRHKLQIFGICKNCK